MRNRGIYYAIIQINIENDCKQKLRDYVKFNSIIIKEKITAFQNRPLFIENIISIINQYNINKHLYSTNNYYYLHLI